MYALWKTAGITVSDWQSELSYGAVVDDKTLYLTLSTSKTWKGQLHFGKKWHQEYLKMPVDYPRINQFQEWYPIEPLANYQLTVGNKSKTVSGEELLKGYSLEILPYKTVQLKLKRL
jgi:hypothetical protein